MMNLHKPVNVSWKDEDAYLAFQTATCSECGQEIDRFQWEDDDMGLIWSKWTASKQGKQPWAKCFGVSS